MNLAAFLLGLKRQGVEVMLADGRLLTRAARGTLTPELADELRNRKAEIIAFLREALAEHASASPIPPLRPRPRQELMPLSFTQERLWYLNQVETDPAVFNLPLCLRIQGPLRADVLQRCLDELEARHETMRTTIVVQDGVAFQKVHAPRGLPLRHVEVGAGAGPGGLRTAQNVLTEETSAPFDLAARPAVRATLVRLSAEEHFLLVMIHHTMTDGASLGIVLEELVTLYEAFGSGRPSPLPPPTLQFADYAAWQREWLQGRALDEQLDFWKERLGGELPVLDLPTDRPRPPIRGSSGAKEPVRLARAVVEALTATAMGEGATGFMAMLALFLTLLNRYSGQDDLIVGAPVANRTRAESRDIVGYIANTLVFRTDLGHSPSFREVIRRVRDGCLGAFRHQDMPFQKIVEALQPPRDLSRTPIFQVFFTYDEVFVQPAKMGDLSLSRVIAGSTVARQDLSLFLRHVGGEVHGSLEYNTDLFVRETVLRMIAHFGVLARSAAASPDTPIAALDILTSEDIAALDSWNATAMACPDLLLHEQVEAQARATPGRVAIRAGDASVTYGELQRRAAGLLRVLRARGVGTGDLVGVCLDRSVDLVPALLAVLKAGAAYVPMDPDYPASRLAYMVEDAGIRVLLTQRALMDRLPSGALTALCVDQPAPGDEATGAEVDSAADPEGVAYVIYTSGSTGKPKGVEVRHRNLTNFLAAMRERPGIRGDEVVVAVTTLSFDIALLELFLPLTAGGQVVLASREEATDGAALAARMRASGVTMMQATPATWRLLLDSGWPGEPGLKVLCGGEAMPADLASRLIPVVGELWNMYGPTETTVWSTCARVDDPAAPITIGRPIGNTLLRVIGREGQQQPIGVPGELYIGGAGVAKGYLGRAELTAERFVRDPAGQASAGLCYRTGDLVRLRPGGNVEYLGRLDNQVKVQGFRIELGEIETHLLRVPEVREAVASVLSRGAGDARLAAYVVYRPGQHRTPGDVRSFLREHLPPYMVPGAIVALDALPRTLNNKIDRKALPDPAVARAGIETGFAAPRTPTEMWLASAWAALLHLDRVGIHDDFFELGGQSLLAPRMTSSVAAHLGVDVPLRDFLLAPTVAALAEFIEARRYVGETAETSGRRERVVI